MNEITITDSALSRIKEVQSKNSNINKFLRIVVEAGGCSGLQYVFSLDDKKNDDDIVVKISDNKVMVVSDPTSLEFLKDCEIDFVQELGAQYFKVKNPNAKASCGCGSSFAV